LLNHLGDGGWELVDVEGQVFYLKRPKPSAASKPQIDTDPRAAG